MNTHEHRAKEVLNGFGAPIAAGVAITNLDQAEAAITALPGPAWVVKSQIHAGGRGKGGVQVSFPADEALVNVR
jgi:succinyl-CoA synthetase beta subunit